MNAPQIMLLMLLVATLRGQEKDFSKAYPFTERKPKTKIETAIDRLLPSIVKVQGASGFATIESSASGLIVSKRGHILTLDQVILQKVGPTLCSTTDPCTKRNFCLRTASLACACSR